MKRVNNLKIFKENKVIPEEQEPQELESTEEQKPESKRGIANIFDIKSIQKELEEYDVEIEILPARRWDENIQALYIRAAYQGKDIAKQRDSKDAALVALFVDYSDSTALAMARGGADKQTMLLISSVANKHINAPFKYNKDIRNRLS